MTVLVDTREQAAYSFDARLVVAERRPLPSGDYSGVGLEGVAPVERKTLDDGDVEELSRGPRVQVASKLKLPDELPRLNVLFR